MVFFYYNIVCLGMLKNLKLVDTNDDRRIVYMGLGYYATVITFCHTWLHALITFKKKILDVYSMNSTPIYANGCVCCVCVYILKRLLDIDIHNNAKEVSCLLCIVYLNWKLVCCCWHKSNIFGICVWRGEKWIYNFNNQFIL